MIYKEREGWIDGWMEGCMNLCGQYGGGVDELGLGFWGWLCQFCGIVQEEGFFFFYIMGYICVWLQQISMDLIVLFLYGWWVLGLFGEVGVGFNFKFFWLLVVVGQ